MTDREGDAIVEAARALLPKVEGRAVKRALALLRGREVRITKPPETALVMMRVQDPFDTAFCMGEVLVTSAEVSLGRWKGYGSVVGDEPEKALLAASIEAVFQGGDTGLIGDIKRWVAAQRRRVKAMEDKEAALLASTRVDFEIMPAG